MSAPMGVKNEELEPLFVDLRALLGSYAPPLIPHHDSRGYFDLWSEKPVVIAGRNKDEVFFAGLIIQKSYVGFYFMPLGADEDPGSVFGPLLLKARKGKSCYYIRGLTPALAKEIERALAAGYRLFQERDWV